MIAFLADIFNILIVKLILYSLFKITYATKKMFCNDDIKKSIVELEELNNKREKFLKSYVTKIYIYIIVIIVLVIIFGFFSTCYGGVFINSVGGLLWRFVFAFIFAFILCFIVCFIICLIYKLGMSANSRCLLCFYYVAKTIY